MKQKTDIISARIDFIKASLNERKKSLVLIGLMGAGKSAVGKALSEAFDVRFIDSDNVIEANHGSISDYFKNFGEDKFRVLERNTIATFVKGDLKIISTGGGAFMNEQTRAFIKDNAVSVWLKADVETLYDRVKDATHRPLLEGVDKRTKLQELANLRYPIYGEADVHVEVTDADASSKQESIAQNRDRVINALYTHLKR